MVWGTKRVAELASRPANMLAQGHETEAGNALADRSRVGEG